MKINGTIEKKNNVNSYTVNTNRNGCDNVLDVPTDDTFGQPITDGTIMVSMNNKAVLDYILLLQIEDQISITSNMYYHK